MGVYTHEKKVTSAVVLDANNRNPKIVPKAGKGVKIVKGDGRAGTIKKITSPDGNNRNPKIVPKAGKEVKIVKEDGRAGTSKKITSPDGNNRNPKIVPKAGKEVEIVKGDGRAGTIKKITSHDGKYVKHKIDSIDHDNYSSCYSRIDVQKIFHKTKLVAAPGGGTLIEVNTESYTSHTQLEMGRSKNGRPRKKEKATGLLKLVEGYLLANPDAYN